MKRGNVLVPQHDRDQRVNWRWPALTEWSGLPEMAQGRRSLRFRIQEPPRSHSYTAPLYEGPAPSQKNHPNATHSP